MSFWPQIGLDYRLLQETTTTSYPAPTGSSPQPTTSSSSSSSAFGLTVEAPILIHPAKGFFIGAGPAFYSEFSNSSNNSSGNASTSTSASTDNPKVTSLGLMAMIGGASLTGLEVGAARRAASSRLRLGTSCSLVSVSFLLLFRRVSPRYALM